jgi:hypothetical protein
MDAESHGMLRPSAFRRWSIASLMSAFLMGSVILLAGPASPEPVVESARLNARLAQTPLAGLGGHFLIEGARLQNELTLDPRFVVALAGAESSFGTRICTPFNAWNWFWEGPCLPRRPDGSAPSPFSDWKRGIEVVSKFLKKSYLLKGYTTIPLIGSKYCAEGCQHWEPNVTRFYTELGGDLTDLTYAHAVPPEGTGKPIDPGPVTPPGGTDKPVDTGPVTPPGGTGKPIDTGPVTPPEKPVVTKPDAPGDAKAAASASTGTETPPVSRPAEAAGLPLWVWWAALAVAFAGLTGAAGFVLGRRTRG